MNVPHTVIELLESKLERDKKITIPVSGSSMIPTLFRNEFIRIVPCAPEDAKVGDIVAIKADKMLIVHRLYQKNLIPGEEKNCLLTTKGDARDTRDEAVPGTCLLGKVETLEANPLRKVLWFAANTFFMIYTWPLCQRLKLQSSAIYKLLYWLKPK